MYVPTAHSVSAVHTRADVGVGAVLVYWLGAQDSLCVVHCLSEVRVAIVVRNWVLPH